MNFAHQSSVHSTSSSEDHSGDDPDLDCPHMDQAPPFKEGRTSVGDEDSTPAHSFTVTASVFPLLQLQSPEASAFLDILSLPLNNRGSIDFSKLVSRSEDSTILLRFTQNRNKNVSPISGSVHVVLFSFSYNPSGGCSSDQLKSLCTVGRSQSEGKFDVRGMTTKDCARILKWLDPESTFDTDGRGDLVEGKRLTLEQLGKLPVYGSSDQMEDFSGRKHGTSRVLRN